MQLPKLLDIFAFPSTPGRRRCMRFSGIMADGRIRVSPYVLLNFSTISLVCSIMGSWSSPTGTTVASNAVMSAACETG